MKKYYHSKIGSFKAVVSKTTDKAIYLEIKELGKIKGGVKEGDILRVLKKSIK